MIAAYYCTCMIQHMHTGRHGLYMYKATLRLFPSLVSADSINFSCCRLRNIYSRAKIIMLAHAYTFEYL